MTRKEESWRSLKHLGAARARVSHGAAALRLLCWLDFAAGLSRGQRGQRLLSAIPETAAGRGLPHPPSRALRGWLGE